MVTSIRPALIDITPEHVHKFVRNSFIADGRNSKAWLINEIAPFVAKSNRDVFTIDDFVIQRGGNPIMPFGINRSTNLPIPDIRSVQVSDSVAKAIASAIEERGQEVRVDGRFVNTRAGSIIAINKEDSERQFYVTISRTEGGGRNLAVYASDHSNLARSGNLRASSALPYKPLFTRLFPEWPDPSGGPLVNVDISRSKIANDKLAFLEGDINGTFVISQYVLQQNRKSVSTYQFLASVRFLESDDRPIRMEEGLARALTASIEEYGEEITLQGGEQTAKGAHVLAISSRHAEQTLYAIVSHEEGDSRTLSLYRDEPNLTSHYSQPNIQGQAGLQPLFTRAFPIWHDLAALKFFKLGEAFSATRPSSHNDIPQGIGTVIKFGIVLNTIFLIGFSLFPGG